MVEVAVLRRHDLVYIKPGAWPGLLAGHDLGDLHQELACWAALERPTVLRGRIGGDPGDSVPLGLPLPPGMDRKRLAFACSPGGVARIASPVLLSEALPTAPDRWRAAIDALLAEGISWRCFGSLAWQHLTGLPYLTDASDLDLLIHCSTEAQAELATRALSIVAARAPMEIDAELISSTGVAVQWREWTSGATELLVKSLAGPAMTAREALFP
ncbi:malonate decarboxylase holo-[acyl-carrier-protein] synthase [Mesorhizobium hawassense]|uniref:Malonate decarboxylase holo-[acyl-carrier-protein] synthase n=1 Tax=Mesorhizobium hawassense TaxID=1209954 RepID=A0A330HVP2_9HYPH|nr:malonate decarboxylase holo-[acyl-carrier-protein] synthase [Mesorhizobium hawassense]RAZ92363.1 malonate decarboxylase holo-[acyl-carrier-protein] synthase [Mesorhizobium hawassense]